MSLDLAPILERIAAAIPGAGVELRKNPGASGIDSLLIERASLLDVCRHLRDVEGFDFLSCVSGVDWPDAKLADAVATREGAEEACEEPSGSGFLEAVYQLYAVEKHLGPLTLRVRTGDRANDVEVPSVAHIWKSAEFQEREAYDLFGIVFTGHPDLRRILMWDEFVDHPMRKDYVAPDDYEYEPTPHNNVLERAKTHYPQEETTA